MKGILVDLGVLERVPDLGHHVYAEGHVVEELVYPSGGGKERVNLAKWLAFAEVHGEGAVNREQRRYEPMRRENEVRDRNPEDDVSWLLPAFVVPEEGVDDE